jgi:aminoglycoside 3-N-acetyltransferase
MLRRIKKLVKRALIPLRRPMVSRSRLVSELRKLGVKEGGILLVHTSLSRLGFVPGGARTVLAALREVIGKEGTLVLPTHSWEWMNRGLRTFDVRTTAGCVGQTPEVFRVMPGVRRSLHPTHSVAAQGPQADWLLQGHERSDTPCGAGTPYAKLLERDGQILLLGASLESNTAFHTMEALGGFPQLLRPEVESFQLVDAEGRTQELPVAQHLEGVARCFGEMGPTLVKAGAAQTGQVGDAQAVLISGSAFHEVMMDMMEKDPSCLTEKEAVLHPSS